MILFKCEETFLVDSSNNKLLVPILTKWCLMTSWKKKIKLHKRRVKMHTFCCIELLLNFDLLKEDELWGSVTNFMNHQTLEMKLYF